MVPPFRCLPWSASGGARSSDGVRHLRLRRSAAGGTADTCGALSQITARTRQSGVTDPLCERPRLVGLAYRLLGSLSDAEDVVQEAYGRWYALPGPQRDAIDRPGA